MRHVIMFGAALLVVAAAGPAFAGDEVVVKVGHGEVNWTGKTITVTGSASPNLSKGAVVPAQVRLGTERAAELDAYRKILEIVKGVNVDSQSTVGASMQASPEVKARVEGLIKGMKRVGEPKYYADGGVDVFVQITLDGPVTEAVVKPPEKKAETAQAPAPPKEAEKWTGLIVDARGLKLVPALAPRIVDDAGKEIYGPGGIEPEVLKSSGMVAYFLNLESAKKNAKVTDNPVVVKAQKLVENGKCDLVLGKDDAAKVAGTPFLKKGRVVVVVD
ncbi:MAG: hypothetical protein HY897_09740 [Deltaproteobacteria bacterium]|nr:hypothetical protein [Deltaproteobacteria bacterium]